MGTNPTIALLLRVEAIKLDIGAIRADMEQRLVTGLEEEVKMDGLGIW